MNNQVQKNSERICVGYLVPSSDVEGELEFRKNSNTQQNHLGVYYDLKESFHLEENSDAIVSEIEGLDGFHLLEPLYGNQKTNSLVYIDALNATTYDFSRILTVTPAIDVVMSHIGYQDSYSKSDMKVVLDYLNQKGKAMVKKR